ncbi:LamG-like jellyroll fold domain-containing protein [Pseudoalteromonas ardens]|uniref:LamG-like jellyroll fold domain-containing protein n=1 Tax=Pseudoalteromonas ardens TaxID=3048490 RepID=UPI0024C31A0D|nr:LamG-like jellyroll fold domain-containing protein [Pseudoalteromonas sp. R96]MDK1311049.1 hypothetical protein [Pseudoalteromonas sp. R96]
MFNQSFLAISDSTDTTLKLIDPVSVVMNNRVFVFARPEGSNTETIYYRVRRETAGASTEFALWSEWCSLSLEPGVAGSNLSGLLRATGMDLITVPAQAAHPTAADAPFSVTVGKDFIAIFRLTSAGTLLINRLVVVEQTAQDATSEEQDLAPEIRLQPKWEVRYRRSRKKDTPASEIDTHGYRDMDQLPFVEPSLELSGINGLTAGQFSVVLLPTSKVEVGRWYIFSVNNDKKAVTVHSFAQSEEGLFDYGSGIEQPFEITPTLHDENGKPDPKTCCGGISATVFYDREPADNPQSPIRSFKRAGRLMLTIGIGKADSDTGDGLCVYDFSIKPDGRIARAEGLVSPVIDGTYKDGNFTPLRDPRPVNSSSPEEQYYVVPDNAVHAYQGATVSTVALGQVCPSSSPSLLDSADGLIHCYYPGKPDKAGQTAFLVAQYNPKTTRFYIDQSWKAGEQSGTLRFISNRAGSTMNDMTIAISDSIELFCDIHVDYGKDTKIAEESWLGIPRDLKQCADILAGNAASDPSDPKVRSGQAPYFDYQGQRYSANLPLGDANLPSGYLRLVSQRPDIRLDTVSVSHCDSADCINLSVRLTAESASQTITLHWPGLRAEPNQAAVILRGDAAKSTYDYSVTKNDSLLYGIATQAGTIVFGANQALTMGVEIDPNNQQTCCVTIVPASGKQISVMNVPIEQQGFIDAILNDSSAAALFSFASPDPVNANVISQLQQKNLDLRAGNLLFEPVVNVQDSGCLAVADTTASIFQRHQLGTGEVNSPNHLVAATAVIMSEPNNGLNGQLESGSGVASKSAVNGAWVWQPTPEAVTVSKGNAISVSNNNKALDVLNPQRGWTIESWVNPASGTPAQVANFNNGKASTPGGVEPSCLFGTIGKPALDFHKSTSASDFTGSQIRFEADSVFLPKSAFTYECWIKPADNPAPENAIGSIITVQLPSDPTAPLLMLGLNSVRQLTFDYMNDNYDPVTTTVKDLALQADIWQHIAFTGKKIAGKWQFSLYVNKILVHQSNDLLLADNTEEPLLFIGTDAQKDRTMIGSFNEMRFWLSARNQVQIGRSMQMSLSGNEPGLAGYWQLTEKAEDGEPIINLCDNTVRAPDGKLMINNQPVSSNIDGVFLSVLAGIGGTAPLIGHGFLRSNYWNHIAATYQSGTAVYLNNAHDSTKNVPLQYATCGTSDTLNLSVEGSLEAFILLPQLVDNDGVILSKWGSELDNRSYRFYINEQNQLAMELVLLRPEYSNGFIVSYTPTIYSVVATQTLKHDTPYHVFGTFKNDTKIDDSTHINKTKGVLTLYINGEEAGSATTEWFDNATISVNTSDAEFCIGLQSYTGNTTPTEAIESQRYISAVLTGIRIWSRHVEQSHVLNSMTRVDPEGEDAGVISAWWFGEQSGLEAKDKVSGNNARLSSANLWVLYTPLSKTTCYVNGYEVGQYSSAKASDISGYCDQLSRLTFGAYLTEDDHFEAQYEGKIQELRVWSVAKSQAEINSACHSPVVGSSKELIGYWPFNGTARDDSGHGNNGSLVGDPQPKFAPSTAPVANEAPMVRNIYSDHITDFQEPVEGTPAVAEYTSTLTTTLGGLVSVMQREYAYVDESLTILPNFKVGNLNMVYIGQVQTSPTLIGFIEGAPPVPSENLTRPYYDSATSYHEYFGASSIALSESKDVEYQFEYSDYETTQLQSFTTNTGVFGQTKTSIGTGTPFFQIEDQTFNNTYKVGAKVSVEHQDGETSGSVLSTGLSTSITNQLSLRGNWEPKQLNNDDYLNPQVGRRFLPDNTGYALVVSLTADLYSLQIESSGEMAGKVVVPNTEIPPDENIITFPINPKYIKNGTLDGKVGLVNDPDYPNADFQRGSYFNTSEAYVLKNKIDKQTKDAELVFEQFNASKQGRSKDTNLSPAKAIQAYNFDEDYARQSLVNKYVWTADGGLYKEENQAMARTQASFSGAYNLTFAAGPSAEMETAFFIGVYSSIDSLFGSQINVSVTKSRSESRGFGLEASVTGDPTLQGWEPDADNGSGAYSAQACPGKVNAYRFMSYYLAPSTDNSEALLDTVIDDNWYRFSNDPNAIALRSAMIKNNKAWRVLYRTTYVSRVPPHANNSVDQTVGPVVNQAISVEDNQLLIALVQTELGTQLPTKVNLGKAIMQVFKPGKGQSVLSNYLPWWQAFIDSKDPKDIDTFNQLQLDTLEFFVTGFANGQLISTAQQ